MAELEGENQRLRKELAQMRMERDIVKKSGSVLCQGIAARYALMKAWRSQYPINVMAKLLAVSRSGFYAWLKRPLSKPVLKPQEVVRHLKRLGFVESRQKGSHKQFRHAEGRATTVPFTRAKTFRQPYCARLRKTSTYQSRCCLGGNSSSNPALQPTGYSGLRPLPPSAELERCVLYGYFG
ncbi:type II toxin-antitoxin system HicA family toxin [Acidithiobacillus marinus]|uniref:type II toxin-antitoxin system HicA family toxin n=1 Tax=Acidithiobacillus marinus TaxID=187490 RepID=UPI001C0F2882|nr:type II toxin-antitoxin system HicA family toxin [Acidithiobacillus marinus]